MALFLTDEMLPPALAARLCDEGHDAIDIHQAGLRGAPDGQVFAYASAHQRVLISADLGFSNALQYPPGSHPGIIVVRFPAEVPAPVLIDSVVHALGTLSDADLHGALVVLEPSGIRRRGP